MKVNYLTALVVSIGLVAGCATEDMTETRIVFLGDSITEAGDQPGGYVSLVRDALADDAVEVIGAGISGHKVPDLEERLERDVLVHAPTHVVIYIGINDVWHHYEFDHVTGTSPEVFSEGLANLVHRIEERDAEVLLCTPSVIGEDTESEAEVNQTLKEYAALSREVAAATDVSLCDLRAAFEDYLIEHNAEKSYEGILTSDGVHLNEAGNQFVADFMVEHLSEALN